MKAKLLSLIYVKWLNLPVVLSPQNVVLAPLIICEYFPTHKLE